MRRVVYHVHLLDGKLYLRGVFVCVVLGAGADGETERVEGALPASLTMKWFH